MQKIISDKKKVPFKKVVVFKKEIETFNEGLEIDFNFKTIEGDVLEIVGVDYVYNNKLNPMNYSIRYSLYENGNIIEYIENEFFNNLIAI